mmetsp:Transcript_12709/g.9231  ORF Transcript_12709/g.9231 Transcript_12709/m.9231 type:complete len:125 (-) Transcript_12709:16-390(-)
MINNVAVTGVMLASMLESFVSSINKGAAPDITSAWDDVMNREVQRIYERSIKVVHQGFKQVMFPSESSDLLLAIDKIRKEAVDGLEKQKEVCRREVEKETVEEKIREVEKLVMEKAKEAKRKNQ